MQRDVVNRFSQEIGRIMALAGAALFVLGIGFGAIGMSAYMILAP